MDNLKIENFFRVIVARQTNIAHSIYGEKQTVVNAFGAT